MRITALNNWCCYDQIDNKPIEPGTVLKIHWPDGTHSVQLIHLRTGQESASDMGHDITIPIIQAGVMMNVRGEEVFVRLKEGTVVDYPSATELWEWKKKLPKPTEFPSLKELMNPVCI